MKLPKYSIGETLVAPCGYKGKVESISIREKGIYYYGGRAAVGIGWEYEVRREDAPKMLCLFAYRAAGSNEILYSLKPHIESELLIRCTGCDLEYELPLSKASSAI